MKAPPANFLAGLLVFLVLPLAAQHNEVISAAGDSFQNESGSLSFTIGEVAIETTATQPHHLTQGFHQPVLIAHPSREKRDSDIPLTVFPNPVGTQLYLQNHTRASHLYYTVLDARGIPVREGPVTDLTEIPFDGLPTASYLLQVKRHEALVQYFKIIKQ